MMRRRASYSRLAASTQLSPAHHRHAEARVQEAGDDRPRVGGNLCECFRAVKMLAAGDEPDFGGWKESFNALNHPVFGAPNTTVGNPQFGRVTGTANAPRQTQFALKLLW